MTWGAKHECGAERILVYSAISLVDLVASRDNKGFSKGRRQQLYYFTCKVVPEARFYTYVVGIIRSCYVFIIKFAKRNNNSVNFAALPHHRPR